MNVQQEELDQHLEKKAMGQSKYFKMINITPMTLNATLQGNGI